MLDNSPLFVKKYKKEGTIIFFAEIFKKAS